MRYLKISIVFCLWLIVSKLQGQCMFAPTEVCLEQCGPVFYLVSDPPETTYTWSNSGGTITNENEANPHIACFTTPGICTLQVIVQVPLEEPDTCFVLVDVKPTSTGSVTETICEGDSIEINGSYYTPGNWIDTLYGESENGCDSILYITVLIYDPVVEYEEYTGCQGDGYAVIVNGITYDEANPIGIEILETIHGCDSTIIIELEYHPVTFGTITYEGCQGDGYQVDIGEGWYNESNPTGTEVITGSNGCDSIITINLIFHPPTYSHETYIGCEGDGYFVIVDSVRYDEFNPFGTEVITGSNGCDSIITITLVFDPPARDTISYIGCMGDGYSVEVLGHTFDESNPSGTFTIIPPTGCDSIITVDLHFLDCIGTLELTGDQLCVSDTAEHYQWYTCDGILLPDTTQCITVVDTGCVCVIVTQGTDIDTVCSDFKVCLLECEIHAPDRICAGDSILIYYTTNDTLPVASTWNVTTDSSTVLNFTSEDSIWVKYNTPGCFEVELEIEVNGCVSPCIDTICVQPVPEAFICCTEVLCDSCVTLDVLMTGTPPWTIAISDGTTVDTISGIESPVFEYVVCPTTLPVDYTLIFMQDKTCEGVIYDSIASVLEPFPIEPAITFQDDTLCTDFIAGFNYAWRACENQTVLSTNVCFVPDQSGCYCVELSQMFSGCTYTACDVFMLSAINNPGPEHTLSLWYNTSEHSIDLIFAEMDHQGLQAQITDLQGRIVNHDGLKDIGGDMMRIGLADQMPSMVFVTIYTDLFRTTRGVFIPSK